MKFKLGDKVRFISSGNIGIVNKEQYPQGVMYDYTVTLAGQTVCSINTVQTVMGRLTSITYDNISYSRLESQQPAVSLQSHYDAVLASVDGKILIPRSNIFNIDSRVNKHRSEVVFCSYDFQSVDLEGIFKRIVALSDFNLIVDTLHSNGNILKTMVYEIDDLIFQTSLSWQNCDYKYTRYCARLNNIKTSPR